MQYGLSVPASHRRCQSVWVIHTCPQPASSVNVGSVGVGYPYLPPTSVICLEEGMPFPTLHKESLG